MRVQVVKLTDELDMQEACEFTMHNRMDSKQSLETIYECRHSPMRTQLFKVLCYDIPTSASVHLVRHSACGQLHYVSSNRPDRGGSPDVGRETPVDHLMYLNAQHLEEMAWKRLCVNTEKGTRDVMKAIRSAVRSVDPALAKRMVPECVHLGRCIELKKCKKI